MIYTITFNPCIDYIVSMDSFSLGKTNRTTAEKVLPGGKGINVSTVLTNLGISNIALGFIAGFTGEEIKRLCQQRGILCSFTSLPEGTNRINVKLKDFDGTEINGLGPDIPKEKLQELLAQLQHLKDGDSLVLAGSLPVSLPVEMYPIIMEILKDKDSNIVDILKDTDLLFVDTETTGVTRRDTLCLLQIKAGDTVFIIKVNTLPDSFFDAIMDVMNKESKTWVLHNAKFDLKFLYAKGVNVVADIKDTMLMETVLYQGDFKGRLKLEEMAKNYCDIDMDKSLQTSDWSVSLTPEQLTYAADDVIVLEQIYEAVSKEISVRGLEEVAGIKRKDVVMDVFCGLLFLSLTV